MIVIVWRLGFGGTFFVYLHVFENFQYLRAIAISFKAPAMLEISVLMDRLRKIFICLNDTLHKSKKHSNIAA